MTRKPTINSDSVAQDQIRAFVERILRMRQEAQAIKDDIKEIYAEAKGNGFDKTVLGNVVRYVEKTGEELAADQERDALFDLYLAAYQGAPSRTHAHARESDDESDHSPDAGNKVTQPATDPKQVTAAAPAGEGAHNPTSSADPIRPETANEIHESPSINDEASSTAAPQGEAVHGQGTGAETLAGREGRSTGEAASAVLPTTHQSAPGKTGEAVASPAPSKLKMNREFFDAPHPSCQRPEFCGGNSNLGLCEKCKAAAGMIPVVPGGVDIEHRGPVN